MPANLPPIIQPHELVTLAQAQPVFILDASAGADALSNYNSGHLKGALRIDLNNDLADVPEDAANGGRHPLPSIINFAEVLGKLGISAQSHVVVYDDKNGANAAARFWWMLRAAGHTKVQVLNGGFQAAVKAGFPVSNSIVNIRTVPAYAFTNWKLPKVTIDEVKIAIADKQHVVVDVRDAYRYNGKSEPIDLVAGHIPGAINIPFNTNLDTNGMFLAAEILKEKYNTALGHTSINDVIVHCGSGVTACHTLLALDHADLGIPKLYVGSWSEWSRNT